MSFDDDENKRETNDRNFRGRGGMSAALAIEREVRELVPEVLRRDRRSAKIIALHVGATPRAVENWRQGDNLPTISHFLALAMDNPQLRSFIARVLKLDPLDPQRKQLLKQLADFAASLPEEGDQA
jgi:hypothetical protein